MLKPQKIPISQIHVSAARRKTLHPPTVRLIAESIDKNGLQTPIQVRHDGKRYVLVDGLHRLEALIWLGETTVDSYLVDASRH